MFVAESGIPATGGARGGGARKDAERFITRQHVTGVIQAITESSPVKHAGAGVRVGV